MRAAPQRDDPYLEVYVGECPDCAGKGCDREPAKGADAVRELETLLDIWDDGKIGDPGLRCYVPGAFAAEMEIVRKLLQSFGDCNGIQDARASPSKAEGER
jgi:hypothetical protein